MKDGRQSSLCDFSADVTLIRADSVHSEQLRCESCAKKPKIDESQSADTLSELKQGKYGKSFFKKPLPFRISNVKPFAGKAAFATDIRGSSVEKQKDSVMISEWGDCYEDEDIRMSDASYLQNPYEDNWSAYSQNSVFSRFESSVVPSGGGPNLKMLVSPGMVWAMLRTKAGPSFQLVKLSSSLQEVVDTFLKVETGLSLPVSFTFFNDTLPKLLPSKKMGMTLSENLDGHLNEETQGLSFFVGSVNTKLCYKMMVSDLELFQKLFSIHRKC